MGIVQDDIRYNVPIGTGIWTSVFFFITGGLTIGGARSPNKCLVIATMVMSIISAVCAGILIILSGIFSGVLMCKSGYHDDSCKIPYIITAIAGFVIFVTFIVTSAITCRAVCCLPLTNEGKVHYTAEQSLAIQIPTVAWRCYILTITAWQG